MLNQKLPLPYSATQHIIDGSKLSRFMECPRSFFYEYLLGWRSETPNNHLVFGQAFHDALEHILINGYTAAVADEAYDIFLKTYRLTLGPDTDELFSPKTPERARRALHAYVERWASDASKYEILYTEIAGRISIDDGRHLYFRMDSLVKERSTGRYGSLEHKTGSRLDNNWREKWDMSMQAGVYSHVLHATFEDVFGIHFNGVFFKKVKTPALQLDFGRAFVKRTDAQMLNWWTNTVYWMDQLETEHDLLSRSSPSDDTLVAFPMNTTACDKWFGCRFKSLCDSWPNPLRRCQTPPLGFIAEFWNPAEREAKETLEV